VVGWVVGPCEAVEEDGIAFSKQGVGKGFGNGYAAGSPVNVIMYDPVLLYLH
jgi:hypothetical protein